MTDIPLHTITLELECEFVKPMRVAKGVLQISSTHFYFIDAIRGFKKQWKLDQITKIYGRRYILQHTALEIFVQSKVSFFFNFTSPTDCSRAFKKILNFSPSVVESHIGPFDKLLKKADVTKLWQQRKISNFDYLMALNTISGR